MLFWRVRPLETMPCDCISDRENPIISFTYGFKGANGMVVLCCLCVDLLGWLFDLIIWPAVSIFMSNDWHLSHDKLEE